MEWDVEAWSGKGETNGTNGTSFWTTSLVKMLISVNFRGFEVALTRQMPVESFLGRVRYRRSWLLRSMDDA